MNNEMVNEITQNAIPSCWLPRAGFTLAYTPMVQDLNPEFLKYNNRFKATYFCLWKEWSQDSLECNMRALFLFKHPLTSLPNNKEILTSSKLKSLQCSISPFFIFTWKEHRKDFNFPSNICKKPSIIHFPTPNPNGRRNRKLCFKRVSTSFPLPRFKMLYGGRHQHCLF